MKKRIFISVMILMIFIASSGLKITANELILESISVINEEQDIPYFDNVVLITWDGTNSEWFKRLIDNGTLVNSQRVLENGYQQLVRVTSHITSTDPGLATLETGYGPEIQGIFSNQFGAGSEKLSISDGLSTFERLEDNFGTEIQTSMFFSWATNSFNGTYINQDPDMWDSIYGNIERGKEVDYWFASENLTWVPGDTETLSAILNPFAESINMYRTPLLKAEYLGNKAAAWVTNHTNERFYLRMHLTEPDQAGHGFGVTQTEWSDAITPEYMQSLVDCDLAVGSVYDVLESAGVLDKTLFIIGSDHGMYYRGHDASSWPADNWVKSETTFVFSNTSVQNPLGSNVPINQKDIAPTIVAAMGVDLSSLSPAYVGDDDTGIPIWELSDNQSPTINSISYQRNDEDYQLLSDGSRIGKLFNLSMSVLEWCTVYDATLEIDGIVFDANSTSSKSVRWYNVDTSSLSGGSKTLLFTLTDAFGNTATLEVNNVKTAPISMWISITGLLVLGSIIYIRKRNK
ncbi:MAG: alkaline phosphatase family protein [Candidatus Heimdallarchaeota archaeon]|nr:alkaline phosphatase family protein [Candidatus Heimdallarchaeota archaeon]